MHYGNKKFSYFIIICPFKPLNRKSNKIKLTINKRYKTSDKSIEKAIKTFSKEGLRVLCMGFKEIDNQEFL